ncbi:hypothetical protein [Undibacterium sp. TJN19]|uniref:hypothetical protein n=1 Tax=Undibacterium sp. TJN19 TaxID=3413055 RepID=UPI003BF3ADD6
MPNYRSIIGPDGVLYDIDTSDYANDDSLNGVTSEDYDGARRSGLPPYFSQASNDSDDSPDIPSFGEMLARRGADQSDIGDGLDDNGKSAFLRSEKASYRAGDFDGRDVSQPDDTMTALFKKNYGYAPSPGELIQFAKLNDLRSAHDLPVNQLIRSPSLDILHGVDVSPPQLNDFMARDAQIRQDRNKQQQMQEMDRWRSLNGTRAEMLADPTYQNVISAKDNIKRYLIDSRYPDDVVRLPVAVSPWTKGAKSAIGMLGSTVGAIEGGAMTALGGALVAAPEPVLTKIAGVPLAAFGGATVAKNIGDFGMNATNLYRAIQGKNDEADYLPDNALEYIAKRNGMTEAQQKTVATGDELWNMMSGRFVKTPQRLGPKMAEQLQSTSKSASEYAASKFPSIWRLYEKIEKPAARADFVKRMDDLTK